MEPAPSTVLYRKSERISVKTLLDSSRSGGHDTLSDTKIQPKNGELERQVSVEGGGQSPSKTIGIKLGWINGVFIPVLLNIWGVIMFLRLGYVVGQAGIVYSWLILLCGKVVTTITTLSLCAICTNGEVQGGGVYFLVSRALGPIHGGVIGVLFFVAQAVATSMYIIGFAESLSILFTELGMDFITGTYLNDIRLLGGITLVILQLIAIVGMGWFAKTQGILLVALVVAMISIFGGSFAPGLPDTLENADAGFVGYASRNWDSVFIKDPVTTEEQSFFSLFAVFFPACTGIMAGANLSGDLKDPSFAIPKGTLAAIGITFVSYAFLILVMGLSCLICVDSTDPYTCGNITESIESGYVPSGGLIFNKLIMKNVSFWSPLVYIGVFAATLSSALASMVGAPRILQSLASDGIYPWRWVAFFGKGHGPSNDPFRGYGLTFVICLGCVLIGKLDVIAPLISNFFMISYAFTNYACFASSMGHYPGWRPSFQYYNKWLSLFGFIICVVVMFLMDWMTTIVTLALAGAMYAYLIWHDPDVQWGAAGEARKYFKAVQQIEVAQGTADHVKTFRPQFLVMAGPPSKGAALIKFVSLIGKGGGVVVCGDVIRSSEIDLSLSVRQSATLEDKDASASAPADVVEEMEVIAEVDEESPNDPENQNMSVLPEVHIESSERLSRYINEVYQRRSIGQTFLENQSIWTNSKERCSGAFYDAVVGAKLSDGLQSFLQISGLGPIRPNTVVLGFKKGWKSATQEDLKDYEIMIRISLASNLGVMVVRDDSKVFDFDNEGYGSVYQCLQRCGQNKHSTASTSDDGFISSIPLNPREKLNGDTIDVWWVADDGGLTMLLPYLMTQHKSLRLNQKLRVLTLSDNRNDETQRLVKSEMRMIHLLTKFRIEAEVQGLSVSEELDSRIVEELADCGFPLDSLTGEEKSKTVGIIQLAKLLRETTNSRTSMIYVTLPIPIKGVQTGLYSCWLDILSAGSIPTIMIRGNNENVMTFLC